MPLSDPTQDLALLAEMRSGNATAFEQLYHQHQGPLYRFALLRCGSPAAADVVQEIFLALLNNTLKFDPGRGVLQGFLFGVARNFLSNNTRRIAATCRTATRPILMTYLTKLPTQVAGLCKGCSSTKLQRVCASRYSKFRRTTAMY